MEQRMRVQKLLDDGTAQLLLVRQNACSGDCHQCGGCGAPQQKLLVTAQNPIGAKPGDLVVVQAETAHVLKAAVMLYILPVLLLIGGYLAGEWLWQKGVLTGLLGLLAGFALVGAYDRHLSKKHTTYTITARCDG